MSLRPKLTLPTKDSNKVARETRLDAVLAAGTKHASIDSNPTQKECRMGRPMATGTIIPYNPFHVMPVPVVPSVPQRVIPGLPPSLPQSVSNGDRMETMLAELTSIEPGTEFTFFDDGTWWTFLKKSDGVTIPTRLHVGPAQTDIGDPLESLSGSIIFEQVDDTQGVSMKSYETRNGDTFNYGYSHLFGAYITDASMTMETLWDLKHLSEDKHVSEALELMENIPEESSFKKQTKGLASAASDKIMMFVDLWNKSPYTKNDELVDMFSKNLKLKLRSGSISSSMRLESVSYSSNGFTLDMTWGRGGKVLVTEKFPAGDGSNDNMYHYKMDGSAPFLLIGGTSTSYPASTWVPFDRKTLERDLRDRERLKLQDEAKLLQRERAIKCAADEECVAGERERDKEYANSSPGEGVSKSDSLDGWQWAKIVFGTTVVGVMLRRATVPHDQGWLEYLIGTILNAAAISGFTGIGMVDTKVVSRSASWTANNPAGFVVLLIFVSAAMLKSDSVARRSVGRR